MKTIYQLKRKLHFPAHTFLFLLLIYYSSHACTIFNKMKGDTNLTGSPPCWRYNTANQMLHDCDVSIESFGYILAAVHQEGNFPAQYSNVYDLKNRKTPKHFQLLQSYPNPFNPSTTIRYNLKESSDVIIIIYNLAGQELVALENGFKTAGEHDIKWTPDGLPSGIYLCRLQAGDFLETEKLILQKQH